MSPKKLTSWELFWDQAHSIYANERHLRVHYQWVARSINAHIAGPEQIVLDYGCGDALSADLVAVRCKHLYLFETAVQKRLQLTQRFAHVANISVLDEAQLAQLAKNSLDRVVINSVLQYLSPEQAGNILTDLRSLLAPKGQVIVADVIDPQKGMMHDVLALLKMGWTQGFLGAAVVSLFRTYFSSYRRMRNQLGLTNYTEPSFVALAAEQGFEAQRIRPNFGHNQVRMAFRLTTK